MRAAEGAGEHPAGVAAIRLLLLMGFRRLEGLGLRRDWLNADESAVCFPDTKSGAQKSPAHLTPPSFRLSADPDALKTVIDRPALELLLAQPRSEKSPFFFPAARAQTRSSTRTMPMKCPSPQSIAELPPERRERVDARYRELRQEVGGLRELREIAGKAQLDVAAALHITQPSVSKLEKQADMYLSTLRNYVEAIGGELELTVKLPRRLAFKVRHLGDVAAVRRQHHATGGRRATGER